MLHILNSQNTVLNKFVAEIRDKSIQKDSMRFRRHLSSPSYFIFIYSKQLLLFFIRILLFVVFATDFFVKYGYNDINVKRPFGTHVI